MKYLLLNVVFFLLYGISYAQQNFEGEILYKNESSNDTTKNELKIFLKDKKMLLINDVESTGESIILYDFIKGFSYLLMAQDSVAVYSKLSASPFLSKKDTLATFENIAGYRCNKTSYTIYQPMNEYVESIDGWFSNKIIFKIPDTSKFIIPPFIFFNDSSISLKVKIIAKNPLPGSEKTGSVTYVAQSIIKKDLADSLFEIPAFMSIISQRAFSQQIMKKFKEIDFKLNETEDQLNIKMEIFDKKLIEINKQKAPPLPPVKKKN